MIAPSIVANDFAPRKGMTAAEIDSVVAAILAEATLEEKVGMMSGKGFFKQLKEDNNVWGARPYRAGGGIERLGVPAFYFTDGPRGVARGRSTCFPCTMARGAAFDVDLERRIGEVMGIEARAQDCNLSGAVCINLLRHPAWGRAQETYGEDPHHMGELALALGAGIQAHNVCATVKHFALNSMENARFKVDVRIDPRTLREVYLPHFKRAIDGGVASVMSAYNQMNGEYCGQHRELLTDILRGEWGFDGWVHSDWIMGVYHPYGASAGLDVENPEPRVWGDKLIAAVQERAVEPEVIDRACRRILTTLYRFACAEDPLESYPVSLVASPAHVTLAREAAEKSAVLLENDGALPLDRAKVKRLAVLGRLAGLINTGDYGSSLVRAPHVVTPLSGLAAYLEGHAEIAVGDEGDLAAAGAAAASADAVVVVCGYTAAEEGEYIPGGLTMGEDGGGGPAQPARGGDRVDLGLPVAQIALIEAAKATGKPVIVVIVAGSAVLVEGWREGVSAILQTFYAGMEGGSALARLLFGEVSPSGKLPFTVAKDAADYPFFDKDADRIEYGPWHGYTLMEREARTPRYDFGHGLSYARFSYRALKVRRGPGEVQINVSVRNDGAVTADEIVQVYTGFPSRLVERPAKLLRGFRRVTLAPGETATLRFLIPDSDLRYYDAQAREWRLEPGEHRILAGGSSRDAELLSAMVVV
jgi:beta-glucosidase